MMLEDCKFVYEFRTTYRVTNRYTVYTSKQFHTGDFEDPSDLDDTEGVLYHVDDWDVEESVEELVPGSTIEWTADQWNDMQKPLRSGFKPRRLDG